VSVQLGLLHKDHSKNESDSNVLPLDPSYSLLETAAEDLVDTQTLKTILDQEILFISCNVFYH
jgi:hypothetical protein